MTARQRTTTATTAAGVSPGILAPVFTFFKEGEGEELDLGTFQRHIGRLAKAGVGILIGGSNGEATHLTPVERQELIKTARQTLDSHGFEARPIMVGTGAPSTLETIKLTREAAEAGASSVIVIAPGYFAFALSASDQAPEGGRAALLQFYSDVISASEVPVLVYNFPKAAGGIDLDSDFIAQVAKMGNCVGTKLTCANMGKASRLIGAVSTPESVAARNGLPFHVFSGFMDTALAVLINGGAGSITGLANVFPFACAHLYTLWQQFISSISLQVASASDHEDGKGHRPSTMSLYSQMQILQHQLAEADSIISGSGIGGTKLACEIYNGYGGSPRRPLPRPSKDSELAQRLANHSLLRKLHEIDLDLEQTLTLGDKAPTGSAAFQ